MSHHLETPAIAELPSSKQKYFVRYFVAISTDLIVLNLLAQYWQHVIVESFAVSLLAAVLLQLLLRLTLAIEHRAADYFNSKAGKGARFMRFFSAWAILFGSKFVMLWAIDVSFGGAVLFTGPLHGVVVFIVAVVAMLGAEELVARIYRSLAG